MAIAASTLDSLLDFMAGGILWFTHLSMKNINMYKYPIGKLRMQPVGIIIFAAVMATLGVSKLLYRYYYSQSNFLFNHNRQLIRLNIFTLSINHNRHSIKNVQRQS